MPVVRLTVWSTGGAGVTGGGVAAGGVAGRGNRRVLLGRSDGALVALLFDADFLFERAPQLVGGLLELADALAERTAEFGSFRGPKMMSAITRMMISSGMPMEPNIRCSSRPAAGFALQESAVSDSLDYRNPIWTGSR